MEKLKRALEICEEIEKLQAELREILQNHESEKSQECKDTKEPEIAEQEVVTPQVSVIVEAEKPCNTADSPTVKQSQNMVLRKYFTINDRFRFRRELFGGDDAAFLAAVDTISEMSTLQEADNFLAAMPWDHDSEAVAEFMTLISNYFNRH